jgi:hypothetical protein
VSLHKICGERLEVDHPEPHELDWIFAALNRPEVHLAFDCPRPPSPEEFRAGLILLAGSDAPEPVRYVVSRCRGGGPICFFLDFMWDDDEATRDVDSCIPDEAERGFRNAVESYVLFSCFLYYNGLARRMRVQQPVRRDNRPRWLETWGGRYLGMVDRIHPITGEAVKKHVHEHTPGGLVNASPLVKRILRSATVANGEPLAKHAAWCAAALDPRSS